MKRVKTLVCFRANTYSYPRALREAHSRPLPETYEEYDRFLFLSLSLILMMFLITKQLDPTFICLPYSSSGIAKKEGEEEDE